LFATTVNEEMSHPCWSPDGSAMAFVSWAPGKHGALNDGLHAHHRRHGAGAQMNVLHKHSIRIACFSKTFSQDCLLWKHAIRPECLSRTFNQDCLFLENIQSGLNVCYGASRSSCGAA
jgi:hypothetical protein